MDDFFCHTPISGSLSSTKGEEMHKMQGIQSNYKCLKIIISPNNVLTDIVK